MLANSSTKEYSVVIADDHTLMRNALARLVSSFDKYNVVFEAGNGKEVIEQLKTHGIPAIILLDISMLVMDGFETAEWITKNYPQIKIWSLSMQSDEESIIKMLKLGAKGY